MPKNDDPVVDIEHAIIDCYRNQDRYEKMGKHDASVEEARFRQGLEFALHFITGETTEQIRKRTFARYMEASNGDR